MKIKIFLITLFVMMILSSPLILAAEEVAEGIEPEKILNLGSSILALVLAAITFVAFGKSKKNKLVYISAAFLLFGIKTFLIGSEIFFGEWIWVDTVSSLIDFAILITFFVGIIKK